MFYQKKNVLTKDKKNIKKKPKKYVIHIKQPHFNFYIMLIYFKLTWLRTSPIII